LKYLLIIFSLLLTSGSWCDLTKINNISLSNKIEKYKWKKRILLLITKEEDTGLINEVDKFFINQKCKNDERNLELLKIKKDDYYYKKNTNFFKDKTGIWLIGYDGNIKGYSEDYTLLSNLHNLIDNMSIRKNEMKNLKENC
jgi:hypothetical protein